VVAVPWLTGCGLWLALAVRRLRRFRRLLRFARPAPEPLQQRACRLAWRLGLRRCPRVWLVPGPVSPMLWALVGPPRLLLPETLWGLLSADQQDTLLAHELAHLRRGDHWVRRLELLALGLYWWHPAAWLARRELRDAEEQCCDAWVVWALPGAAAAYAAALVETVAFLSEARSAVPAGASAAGHVHRLKRRLIMIVRGTTPRGLGGAGLALLMALGALLLPLFPTRALTQTPGDGATDAPPVRGTEKPREAVPTSRGEGPPADSVAPVTYSADRPVAADEGQDAADAVELARAQLDVKVAELAEAKALLDRARRQAERYERLNSQKAIGQDELEAARTDVAVQEARVQAKEAQVREAQVRLKQAERRPGSGRRSGRKVSDEEPPMPTARQRVDDNPFTPAPRERPAAADVEQRLRELEKKVDGLLKEMEALRRDLKQRPGTTGAPAPGPQGPTPGGNKTPDLPRATRSPEKGPTPSGNAIR
jgi:Zn-dependent protease with chaperone function